MSGAHRHSSRSPAWKPKGGERESAEAGWWAGAAQATTTYASQTISDPPDASVGSGPE